MRSERYKAKPGFKPAEGREGSRQEDDETQSDLVQPRLAPTEPTVWRTARCGAALANRQPLEVQHGPSQRSCAYVSCLNEMELCIPFGESVLSSSDFVESSAVAAHFDRERHRSFHAAVLAIRDDHTREALDRAKVDLNPRRLLFERVKEDIDGLPRARVEGQIAIGKSAAGAPRAVRREIAVGQPKQYGYGEERAPCEEKSGQSAPQGPASDLARRSFEQGNAMAQESLQYVDVVDTLGVAQVCGGEVRPHERCAKSFSLFGAFRVGRKRVGRPSPERLRYRFSSLAVLISRKSPERGCAVESQGGKDVRSLQEGRINHDPVGDIDGSLCQLQMPAFLDRRSGLGPCAFLRRAATTILRVRHDLLAASDTIPGQSVARHDAL